jgi:predicted RNase H-like HicB family nuclease
METKVVPRTLPSYKLVINEAEEGGYWGEILEVPGCVSQGETIDELLENIEEALEAVLELEEQASDIRFYIEPVFTEDNSIFFGIVAASEQDGQVIGIPDTWTAIE